MQKTGQLSNHSAWQQQKQQKRRPFICLLVKRASLALSHPTPSPRSLALAVSIPLVTRSAACGSRALCHSPLIRREIINTDGRVA